ncbi:hypothetical protein RhiirA1_476217 [Rhizophagus irregularis]|uniref:Uncharacterized protein n=1 Tax=Rhizophagus irregularis TaxID=588596 RepID=A0A2N0QVK2_9GLOM|nr:hypothetical protein RhiirA1_476217 [Rhizophagus irregularis]
MKYDSLESSQQDESNGSKIAFLGLIKISIACSCDSQDIVVLADIKDGYITVI